MERLTPYHLDRPGALPFGTAPRGRVFKIPPQRLNQRSNALSVEVMKRARDYGGLDSRAEMTICMDVGLRMGTRESIAATAPQAKVRDQVCQAIRIR